VQIYIIFFFFLVDTDTLHTDTICFFFWVDTDTLHTDTIFFFLGGYGYIAYWYNMFFFWVDTDTLHTDTKFFFLGGYGYIAYWYNIYLFWLDTDTLHTKTIRKKTLKAYLLVNWMRWKTLFLFFLFYQDPIESDSWSDSAVDVVKDCEDTFPESTLQDIFRRWYWRHWKTLFRDVTFQKKLLKTPFRIDTARHLSVSFSEMTFQNEG